MKKLIFIFAFLPTVLLAQHSIKGTFSPAEEYNYAILYKVTPNSNIYISNAEIKNGEFNFELDSTVTKGMYRMVYALPQDEYNFDIIYSAEEDVVLNFDQEIGVNYTKSTENMLISSYTENMAVISQSIGEYFRVGSKDTLALSNIFKTQSQVQNEFEKTSKGTIAESFIKANKPYIPEGYQNIKDYLEHLKEFYFANVNFNDEILQSSNFLPERIINYVFGMTDETLTDLETYNANINDVFDAMKDAELPIKKMLLTDLWQQMVDLNLESTANYISDTYLIAVAENADDKQLATELRQFKNTSIGTKAPDFSFETSLDDVTTKTNLSSINTAEEYVIVFWSSACSHCLQEIPQLRDFIKTQEENKVQVIAVGLEDNSENWRSLVDSYPDFIHVLGLGKWTNKLGKLYNIKATPTYFVLDKEKKIVAKPNDISVLKEYFQN